MCLHNCALACVRLLVRTVLARTFAFIHPREKQSVTDVDLAPLCCHHKYICLTACTAQAFRVAGLLRINCLRGCVLTCIGVQG
jgi:hypothetical protein